MIVEASAPFSDVLITLRGALAPAPATIEKFTGHLGGAVYGSTRKQRSGRTAVDGLFLCGTDQGYLGIVGAMLSGIAMANQHALASTS